MLARGKLTVGNKSHGAVGVYVGRPSPLGNPYHLHTEADRSNVIAKYRVWLKRELSRENSLASREIGRIATMVAEGQDICLLCWCAPRACHADVIAEVINDRLNIRTEEKV